MNFNKHLELNGGHAVFGASQNAWLRYDEDKIIDRVNGLMAKSLGTEIHDFARSQIELRIRSRSMKSLIDSLMTYIYRKYFDEELDCLSAYGEKLLNGISRMSRDIFATLQSYINDCVGFCMTPEQKLCYDPIYFFGTADCISFRDDELRIHDLKTGRIQAHMDQLMIYTAFFCLEYKVDPRKLKLIELRIYQNNEIVVHHPEPEEILDIMEKVKQSYSMLTNVFEGEGNRHEPSDSRNAGSTNRK